MRSRDQQTAARHRSENVNSDVVGPVHLARSDRRRPRYADLDLATYDVLYSRWRQHSPAC